MRSRVVSPRRTTSACWPMPPRQQERPTTTSPRCAVVRVGPRACKVWPMPRSTPPALREVLRFLTVGGVATLVALAGFNALAHGLAGTGGPLHERPIEAYVLANTVAGIAAYVGLRIWAFRDRDLRGSVSGPV